MPRIQESVAGLEIIVFEPIEEPDRIAVSYSDAPLRAEVDAVQRDIIVDDIYGLGFDAITTEGATATRVHQVTADPG